jgi:hypothetical protein
MSDEIPTNPNTSSSELSGFSQAQSDGTQLSRTSWDIAGQHSSEIKVAEEKLPLDLGMPHAKDAFPEATEKALKLQQGIINGTHEVVPVIGQQGMEYWILPKE